MRNFKNLIAAAVLTLYVILLFTGVLRSYLGDSLFGGWLLVYVIIGFYIFNFSVRKILFFKSYFSSKFNILCCGHEVNFDVDIPADLLFDKLIEVIQGSDYRLRKVDKMNRLLLSTSSFSSLSWGENIYIQLNPKSEFTQVSIYSVCIVGVYDWGRNKTNCGNIMRELEESLIV